MRFREVHEIIEKIKEEVSAKTEDEYSFKLEFESYVENLISWFKNENRNPKIFRMLKDNMPPWLEQIYIMDVNKNPWRIKRENTRRFKENVARLRQDRISST